MTSSLAAQRHIVCSSHATYRCALTRSIRHVTSAWHDTIAPRRASLRICLLLYPSEQFLLCLLVKVLTCEAKGACMDDRQGKRSFPVAHIGHTSMLDAAATVCRLGCAVDRTIPTVPPGLLFALDHHPYGKPLRSEARGTSHIAAIDTGSIFIASRSSGHHPIAISS